MFSGDKSERKKSTEQLKYSSGAQLLLGAGLLACAIIAVNKMGDRYLNYHIGGFTCGISGLLAGTLGLYSFHKAYSYGGDDPMELRNQLGCTMCIVMILGMVVFVSSFSGIMMNIMFLALDYDSEEDGLKIHMILAVCILVGIVLILCATWFALRTTGTCCNYGYNQRMPRTGAYPNTGATTFSYQNQMGQTAGHQPVFNTGGFNAQPNASYPVSQYHTGGHLQPQPPQPPPYGFQRDVLAPMSTGPPPPPPAYPY